MPVPLAAVGTGLKAIGAVSSIISGLTGPKPHDFCPELPSDMNTRIPGISDDPSWPIHNRFVQDKELDGGKSWTCDNKKTWIWIYTNPSGPFSIEDKGPARLQNFVDRLKALYQEGKIPANFDVGKAYRERVVIGRDLEFRFLDSLSVSSGSGAVQSALGSNAGKLGLISLLGLVLLFWKR